MSRRKRKNWLKYIIVLVLAAVLLYAGFLVWKEFFREEPEVILPTEESPTVAPTVPEEEKPVEEDGGDAAVEDEGVVGKEEVVQFEGANPNKGNEITGAITRAEVSGENLVVRVNINQDLTGGECRLEALKDGSVIYTEKVVVFQSGAKTASCQGFDIATSKLGGGKINIKITVTAGGKTGIIEGEANL